MVQRMQGASRPRSPGPADGAHKWPLCAQAPEAWYPAPADRGDKRYRQYVTRPSSGGTKRVCLPAHDVEHIATEQWLQPLSADDLDNQLDVEDPMRHGRPVACAGWTLLAIGIQGCGFGIGTCGIPRRIRRPQGEAWGMHRNLTPCNPQVESSHPEQALRAPDSPQLRCVHGWDLNVS